MWKLLGGAVLGAAAAIVAVWHFAGALFFKEIPSPYGVEETVARIQQNIQATGKGWALAGLRNPARAIEQDGGNTLPVLMVEACSTRYSGPILKEDNVRFLSILMPCKITVYKKQDGKTYIGTMNAGLMGRFFGPLVGEIMGHVAEDQKLFLKFDPNTPAPEMILPKAAPAGGGGGGGGGGC